MLVGRTSKAGIDAVSTTEEKGTARRRAEDEKGESDREENRARKGIFDGLVIYVNGSTYPLCGDHKLKHLLAENGGRVSIHLGRRQVTHVILGRPSAAGGVGAGGGLAAAKIQKEIRRVGGCGIRYVGVEWVLDSVAAGRRLPEAKYGSSLQMAPKGQQSVYGMFGVTSSAGSDVSCLPTLPNLGEERLGCGKEKLKSVR